MKCFLCRSQRRISQRYTTEKCTHAIGAAFGRGRSQEHKGQTHGPQMLQTDQLILTEENYWKTVSDEDILKCPWLGKSMLKWWIHRVSFHSLRWTVLCCPGEESSDGTMARALWGDASGSEQECDGWLPWEEGQCPQHSCKCSLVSWNATWLLGPLNFSVHCFL